MVNQPNNNAFFLPTPSASAVLIGMHNKSTFSHINLANRETNVIKESFTLTISISSHFHPCLSPLPTWPLHWQILPSSVKHLLLPPIRALPSIMAGRSLQLSSSILRDSQRHPSPKSMAYIYNTTPWLSHTNGSLHPKTYFMRKAELVTLFTNPPNQIGTTLPPGPLCVTTPPFYLV